MNTSQSHRSLARGGNHKALGCKPHEVEPGRSVVNDWDPALFESWADRKRRRAIEVLARRRGRAP